MVSRKHIRYKLLLDEGLPPKQRFPTLNNFHSVFHITHDLKKGASKDPEVYKLAKERNFLMVVFNTKDYKPLITNDKPSVISISTNLSNKQIELKICKLLKNLKPSQKKGCLIKITNEEIKVEKIESKSIK